MPGRILIKFGMMSSLVIFFEKKNIGTERMPVSCFLQVSDHVELESILENVFFRELFCSLNLKTYRIDGVITENSER